MKKTFVSNAIATAILLFTATPSLVFLWQSTLLLTFILFAISAIFILFVKSFRLIPVFLLCGVFGCGVEIAAIAQGAWKYALPNIFDIPFWLFPAWGIAGILSVTIYRFFEYIPFNRKSAE